MRAPKRWAWVSLCDVARLESGHTPSREHPEYWDGGIAWIGIKDARVHHGSEIRETFQTVSQAGLDNSAARLLPAGTVCLSRTASVGYVVVMGREMATSQDFVNWVCGPAIEPHFLKQLLIAENRSLFRFGKGSTHTTIYYPEVKAFHVCLPPVAEQRRIVAKLEALQARSRRAREALDAVPPLLEKLRQSIFAAAFRGDLTKDWRAKHKDVEPASELLKRIRVERKKKWEEAELAKMKAKGKVPPDDKWKAKYKEPAAVDTTGLPELPEGWCWASVEELAVEGPTNGFSPRSEHHGTGTPTLKLSATTKGICILNAQTTKRTVERVSDNESYWLRPGDILIQRANTLDSVGVSAVFDGPEHAYIYPDLMMRVRVAAPLSPRIVWRALSWEFCRKYMRDRATGTAGNMPKVNGDTVRSVPIPLAPLGEQGALLDLLDAAFAHRSLVESTLGGLRENQGSLERSVLARAFRGELVTQDPNDEPLAVVPVAQPAAPMKDRARRRKRA